jgi:hypothetical protein
MHETPYGVLAVKPVWKIAAEKLPRSRSVAQAAKFEKRTANKKS